MSAVETYSNYRDSGVEWLGRVPREWPLVRGKFRFRTKKTINKNLECLDRLALTMNGVIDRSMTENEGLQPSEFNSYQIFEEDDLVFKLIDLENFKTSRVGHVPRRGIMSPAYIRLLADGVLNPRFFYYQYFDLYLRGIYNEVGGQGVRSAINASDLLDLPVLSPSLREQTQIAKFLDYETAKIDALKEKQQQLIALLKEKRRAVISHAVTKGLNPDAPMRDSGVEWLGEVPAHWEVDKLYHLTSRIGDGLHGTPSYQDGTGLYFVNGNNLEDGCIVIGDSAKEVPPSEYQRHHILMSRSTVLLSINGTIGKVAIYADERVILGKSAAYINCLGKLEPRFLEIFFQSHNAHRYYELVSTGTTISNLSLESIRQLRIGLPDLDEQEAITEFCTTQSERYIDLITAASAIAEKLQERRTALISAAVTGKIDVRGWKASEAEAEVA